jgi:integrase
MTDAMVAALKHRKSPYADPELGGHYIRTRPDGRHRFYVITRDRLAKQCWVMIDSIDKMTIAQSRDEARTVMARLKAGEQARPPVPVKPESVADVVANYFERYVAKQKIITSKEKRRIVDRHIIPAWGARAFTDIKRSDVARLCDAIEDKHGAWVADTVLAEFTSIARWYATRDDNYLIPIIPGMKRAKREPRTHLLNDTELLAILKTAGEAAFSLESPLRAFGALIWLLLLSAQRLDKVRTMEWSAVGDHGVWSIRTGSRREKPHAGSLHLPEKALDVIRAQPRIAGNPYVLTRGGPGPLTGLGKLKPMFDEACGVKGWRLHDLRRTARSLMSRAGVARDIGERVLGHAVGSGVERTYDVHDYQIEKTNALQRLADMVDTIVNGTPGDNVLPFNKQTTRN